MKATSVILILLAIIILGAIFILGFGSKNISLQPTSNDGVLQNENFPEIKSYPTEIKSEASDWELYRNERLGFSMKLPKKVEIGDFKNPAESPLHILEDGKSNFVYIRPRYRDAAHTIENSFSDPNDARYSFSWKMTFGTVSSDPELLEFVRSVYGDSCVIVSKTPAIQEGVSDVKVEAQDEQSWDQCPMNFMYVVKYSPGEKRVVTWGIGQDHNFVDEIPETASIKVFDFEMRDSFRFE